MVESLNLLRKQNKLLMMRHIIISIFLVLSLTSIDIVAQVNPIEIFDEVWNMYDTSYSGFVHKDLDWDKLYRIYHQQIDDITLESELFVVIGNMMRHLNDNHVQISIEKPLQHFSSGLYGYLIDDIGIDSTVQILYSKPVSENYFKKGLHIQDHFSYGWLNDSIGYFHFSEFKNIDDTKKNMDTIIHFFSTSKALIVDVRRNLGGEEEVVKAIADYFADKKRKYMITSYKNGPGHYDFTDKQIWYVEPNKSINYVKPVILLIDNSSFSGAETFSMAMREIPHVILVGDNTSGAYADSKWRVLSNGWNVCIPYSFHTDKNGFCWEGIGIPPDYYIKVDLKKPIEDKDELIEFALKLINFK